MTPLKSKVVPGTYKIRIKKSPGYEEMTDVLEVKAGETSSKSYTLVPQYGHIEINSTPKGAEVYLNDKREGMTPFKRELTPGTYRVKI